MTRRSIARRSVAAMLTVGLALGPLPAAQAWQPDGPVRIVVGATPGGPTDLTARMLAERAHEVLGQPVVVENQAGASGNIAAANVARARPDGRTFLMAYGALVLNYVRGDPPGAVDPAEQLLPVAQVVTSPTLILVRRDSGLTNFRQLAERLEAPDGRVAWAPAAPGTILAFCANQLLRQLHNDSDPVPYRGSSDLAPDFFAGRLLFVSDNLTSHLSALKDGSTLPLAVLAAQRSALFPQVPSITELGYSGIDGTSWFGIFAPRGTPSGAVAAMATLGTRLTDRPGIRERFVAMGLEPAPLGTDAVRARIAAALHHWRPIVAELPTH